MKKVFLSLILIHKATESVSNSLISLSKYHKNLDLTLINVFGEWDKFSFDNISIENLLNNKNILKKKFKGFLNSRVLYFQILFFSYLPLKKILDKKKPDYLIIHLLTSIPLVLFYLKLTSKDNI